MGGQFQSCKETSTLDLTRTPIRPTQQHSFLATKLCASNTCLPSQAPREIYLQFMEHRPRLNADYNQPSQDGEDPSRMTPKIQHSRAQVGVHRRNTIDGQTIKRREALGRMLAEKLGLLPSNELQMSAQQRQKKERLSEVVYKICTNNQEHLIDMIDRMENTFKASQTCSNSSLSDSCLERFLFSISKTELDFLDMLYHKDEELYRSGRRLRFNRNITENILDIKEMMMEEKEFPGSPFLTYEKYKSRGLQLIRNQKVCFFLLAGGKSSRYLISKSTDRASYPSSAPQSQRGSLKDMTLASERGPNKDFEPLQIPSERSMVELIMHRFLALSQLLGCHITIYIGISPGKINNLKEVFQKLSIDPKKITIYPFAQKVIGTLDSQGGLVVEDTGEASLWSVGTGDLWNIMRGDKELSFPSATQLLQEGFEYLQVLGTSNVLEKCFDCFALGLAKEYDLDWTTKVVESYTKKQNRSARNLESDMVSVEPKIFINNNEEIYVCEPQETENFPEECRFTFMNSSLFKLEFLQRTLQSPELESLWPRKKTHLTAHTPPFSSYHKVYSYEVDYTDIFRLSPLSKPIAYDNCTGLSNNSRAESPARWRLILCDQADYYPLVYSNASHSDIAHSSRALCDLHKAYLGVEDPNCTIQIDPYISLEGERLEQLREDLREQTLGDDDWIFIQRI